MKRPFKLYYGPPHATEPVEEFDEVEVLRGEYKGFVGVVGTVTAGDGDVKLWPTDETKERFPQHPDIADGSDKCWFLSKPGLKLLHKWNA